MLLQIRNGRCKAADEAVEQGICIWTEAMMVSKNGFSFDLCRLNEMLMKKGLKSTGYLKTGTTIVGLIF
ncbi:hypothetical protein L1987_15406 [Smallanthus sonchifolius]|uniref:Uncharacterized protein n=1 Tax=Smallanthus sonchifolius TaxID=185202 RepID=A0ACB9J8Z3_9ASTR|nr:hypothetical protein L1987_15406 [Smallanthus sonchifolius]